MKQLLLLLFLLAITPLAFCWDEDKKYISPPLLKGKTATVETKPMMFASANQREARLSAGWLQNIQWNELSEIASRLAKKAGNLNTAPSYNNLSIVTDKRFFLVSVNPDVLLVIPHKFTMSKDRNGKSIWHDGSIFMEHRDIMASQSTLYGLNYLLGGLQRVGLNNYIEMSSIFPDVEGTLVLSDFYESPVLLSEAAKHAGWRFTTVSRSDMPHFVQLIAKKQGELPK